MQSFPRVYISESSGNGSRELVVINEAWLPFMVSSDDMSSEREATRKNSFRLFDPNGFHELIQGLSELANETISQRLDTKQGLTDCRSIAESMNWKVLRECLLNMLLGSRRVNYKVLTKDCLSTICGLCQDHAGSDNESECPDISVEKSSEES
ncbi:hypothetical protein REPUB_Repub13aG0237300 [Reevesia pubescens]